MCTLAKAMTFLQLEHESVNAQSPSQAISLLSSQSRRMEKKFEGVALLRDAC
jgi:hypothetical protein